MPLPTLTSDQADAITRAGGMVTSYNRLQWLSLVKQYGLPAVLDEVEAQAMDLRRACHAAEASAALAKAFPLVKSTPGDDREDDQADASIETRAAPPPAPPLPVLPVVEQEADEVGAADTSPAAPTVSVPPAPAIASLPVEPSIPPVAAAEPPKDTRMPAPKLSEKVIADMVRRIEAECARRGIIGRAAAEEAGYDRSSWGNFKGGVMGQAAHDKFEAWLIASAKRPSATAAESTPAVPAAAKAERPRGGAAKPYGREAKPVAIGDPSTLGAAELLAGAETFAAELEAFGAAPKAALVKELVRRIDGCLVGLGAPR